MTAQGKQLINYLSPDEKKIFEEILERANKSYEIIPALYRANKLDAYENNIKVQFEVDKQVLNTLKKKAAFRKAREDRLSRKLSESQIEEIKRKLLEQETTT